MRKITFTLTMLAIMMVGCASFSVQPNYFQSVGETDSGTLLRAYVGDILYTKYDYESRDFVRLTFENSCGMGCTLVATDTIFLASQVNGKYGACGMGQTKTGMMGFMQPINLCALSAIFITSCIFLFSKSTGIICFVFAFTLYFAL